ncbi:MAG: thioredoxin family protein [Gemmatimonadales bacterium]
MDTPFNYHSAFRDGATFPAFLRAAVAQRTLWDTFAPRAPLVQEAAARIRAVPGCWRLLVLADDWCGDAVNTLPIIARLEEALPNLEVRIVPRDRYPALRDRHLTNGSRSIPIVIALDQAGVARGTWGPRPSFHQRRFERELRNLPPEQRYRELRRWYAADRGRSTALEIADLIEPSAPATPADWRGPCHRDQAA